MSEEELIPYFHAHRHRLIRLQYLVVQLRPEEFPLIRDRSRLRFELFQSHDPSKIRDLMFEGRRISEYLSEDLWGKSIEDLPPQEKSRAKAVIRALNTFDEAQTRRVLERHGEINADGSLTPTAEQALRLEKLVDVADRVYDPLADEELGRPENLREQAGWDIELLRRYLPESDVQIVLETIKPVYLLVADEASYFNYVRRRNARLQGRTRLCLSGLRNIATAIGLP